MEWLDWFNQQGCHFSLFQIQKISCVFVVDDYDVDFDLSCTYNIHSTYYYVSCVVQYIAYIYVQKNMVYIWHKGRPTLLSFICGETQNQQQQKKAQERNLNLQSNMCLLSWKIHKSTSVQAGISQIASPPLLWLLKTAPNNIWYHWNGKDFFALRFGAISTNTKAFLPGV